MSTVPSTGKLQNVQNRRLASKLRTRLQDAFHDFPYLIRVYYADQEPLDLGTDTPHWLGKPLEVHLKTERAAMAAAALDGLTFLELFRSGEIDLQGNLYLLSEARDHVSAGLSWMQFLGQIVRAGIFQGQNPRSSLRNVKTHYDIPQAALDLYLDRVYRAYSCAMFEDPNEFEIAALVTQGSGEADNFDSLEKAQWRKFRDAVDFLSPSPGDTLLDVGCGYGGQLDVALEHAAFSRVVGWTLSSNQAHEGAKLLARHDPDRWELNEGDYRQEVRVFDHVTSTGMVSHIGPRGLRPYVRNIRRRVRRGGRYVHHAIMCRHQRASLDREVGVAFNKRYVWPGFHWFTLGQHIHALEQNGFIVVRAINLSPHYAKTAAAWYERMMVHADEIKPHLGESGFRAWQVYLAGASQVLLRQRGHVYRIYCRAV